MHRSKAPRRLVEFRGDQARMIATIFGKKKILEDRLANVFVNALLQLVQQGFGDVAAELNEAPELTGDRVVDPEGDETFLYVVLAGNLMELQRQLQAGQDQRVSALVVSKFAQALGARTSDVERSVNTLQQMMARLNHPSKNTVYAMSKAVFHQYDLFRFQTDEFFRDQRVPHPVVLKRVNGLMGFFLWDWDGFHEQYRVAH